jgi:hypothetical protein
MGTNIKNTIDSTKSRIEMVGNKASFSSNMNNLLEKIKMQKLSEKEVKELKIDSYQYSY